jgi:hypothetical protein
LPLWHLAVDDHLVVLRDLSIRLEHHPVLALCFLAGGHPISLALGRATVLGGSAGHAASLLLRHPILSLLLLLHLLLLWLLRLLLHLLLLLNLLLLLHLLLWE